ncbi:methyl-accepting chemotaxis protein [Marinospirillum minutulum]|uniref:methyl-accepting chemotaxis protein n=1 Tax=Marinospirillum minutulum TaxID=64974 RepID=UPI000414427C|nr:methyl-accepting chemotaxis protein [Marinospirillum minutulum]
MKIINRIYFGFAVLLLIMLAITLFGLYKINIADNSLTQLSQQTAVEQRQAINFRGSVHDRAIAIRDAVLVADIQASSKHQNNIQALDKFYQESARVLDTMFAKLKHSPTEEKMLKDIKAIEKSTLIITDKLLELINSNQFELANDYLLNEASPAYTEWLARINLLIDYQEASIQSLVATAVSETTSFQKTMLITTLLALIIIVLVALSVVRNLKEIIGGEPEDAALIINTIASGDLTVDVKANKNSILSAVEDLRSYLTDITKNSINTANKLSLASKHLLLTAQHNEELISNQKESTQRGATAIAEMSDAVAEVASHTSEAASLAQTAMTEFTAGQAEVNKTQLNINDLASKVVEAAQVIHHLSEDSKEISRVMEVIESIAEQTNLLALNAAIEAARAGDQGRGFAVVADEVRNLALRTQDSTREIHQVIEKMQSSSDKAVVVMNQGQEQATLSVNQAKLAGDALNAINASVTRITDMNHQIAATTDQQSAGAVEISENFNQITSSALEAEEEATKITTASRELEELAKVLELNVKQFKTK